MAAAPVFDACIGQALVPLIAGAALLLVPPGQQLNAAAVADLLQRQATLVLCIVPALLRDYLQELNERQQQAGGPPMERRASSAVRLVGCGGDSLPVDLAAMAWQVRAHRAARWLAYCWPCPIRCIRPSALSPFLRKCKCCCAGTLQVLPSLQRLLNVYGPTEATVVVRAWHTRLGRVKAMGSFV